MEITITADGAMAEKDKRIAEVVSREQGRLGNFIRQRVPDPGEAEDILQDVLFEFVAAYRLPEPIEQVGAWLFRVARNRIVDRFRKKRELPLADLADGEQEGRWLEDALPSPADGPEAVYARTVLLEEIRQALDELPRAQRAVFIAHELEGQSFKEMAALSGTSVNTLLARKRYAVQFLRGRLQAAFDEFNE